MGGFEHLGMGRLALRIAALGVIALAALAGPPSVQAQDYPTKTVTLVVP